MPEDQNNNNSENGALKESLQKCENERNEYLEGWKRAKADFINYKKDEARRLEEVVRFGVEGVVRELISVLDSFDLAIESEKDEAKRKSLRMISGQLEDVLKKFGLERIPFSAEKEFNPAEQEAIAEVPSEKPTGAVVEEISRGYRLSGKVIRPSRVNLSKGQSK